MSLLFCFPFASSNPIQQYIFDKKLVKHYVSQVVDPVDLAVARGGDLQILQQLTDDDYASTPRGDNINKFLRDQRDTLRRGMSKPQVQLRCILISIKLTVFCCDFKNLLTWSQSSEHKQMCKIQHIKNRNFGFTCLKLREGIRTV